MNFSDSLTLKNSKAKISNCFSRRYPDPLVTTVGISPAGGEISFGDESTASTFERVYDKEAKIYQYDNVLPRAAVFHRIEVAPDGAPALARLQDQSLDVLSTAIVEAGDLDSVGQPKHSRNQPSDSEPKTQTPPKSQIILHKR